MVNCYNTETESFNIKDNYIMDYTFDKEIMYREINEDYLYVLLNLILAASIVDYLSSIKGFEYISHNKLTEMLELVITNHYDTYAKDYILLYNLRLFICNNYMGVKDFDRFF